MLIEQLKENYFFAVIRGKDKEDAKNIARYAIKGGIYNIEITFSTPKADEVIKELIEEFKDDKKDRVWEFYTEDGKLERKVTYRNGLYDGMTTEFFKSGKINRTSNYVQGIKNGKEMKSSLFINVLLWVYVEEKTRK